MTQAGPQSDRNDPWGSLEPYVQIIRSLMPRASSVALFDADGIMRWTNETAMGPDLADLVDNTSFAARTDLQIHGQVRILDGDVAVYACWLRDDANKLIAVLAIKCRRSSAAEGEPRDFPFVHSLLRPALECLRRDLLARAAIESLNRTVADLDRDLELLLTETADGAVVTDCTEDLKRLLQTAVEHLKCTMAVMMVPDKGIVLLRSAADKACDNQLLARTHRHLMAMAQMRREPTIINRLAPSPTLGLIPYRILSCPVRQSTGRTSGVLALFREQTAREFIDRDARLADVLARRAASIVESSYDMMSGLLTRSSFDQRIRSVINGNHQGTWSALYIDLDQLHVINDNFGMHMGDTLIGQLGELIRRRLPPSAFAARISGDRFAVMLPTGIEDAETFAEALRDGAAQLSASRADSRLHVSISVGVAPVDTSAGQLAHSLAAAETACKAAKDRGRNRVETYQANDASIIRRFTDIHIAARLREAITAGRLRFDAQLILPFESAPHPRPHFELLLRMIGEDGQTLGPDSFLSAASRYQLMPTLDRWVIDHAIKLLQPHAALLVDRPAVFAINFSGQSLNDESFGDFLLGRIESSGLDPAIFCFELTENATIANIARAEVLMRRLRRLGCAIALDDFGTGLSSLAYLRQLPVTLLKIDGSFVRDILTDARSESMVKAIAQLARSMAIGTVAEYVETEEIRARVATLGVDYGQGFAIGRPGPFEEVLTQLPVLAAASPAYYSKDEGVPERHAVNLH